MIVESDKDIDTGFHDLKHEVTPRNFPIYNFTDQYSAAGTLQLSSLVFPRCIWFGTAVDRMHLSQEMVAQLLPALQHFAETGELPYPEKEPKP